MHLAYERGGNRLWVVNVGDMKGNEVPLQYFMDYAWNPERWPIERLPEWERSFAAQQLGATHAEAVAIDGSESVWPGPGSPEPVPEDAIPALPVFMFSPYQVQPKQYIEAFNRGSGDFGSEITLDPGVEWLTVSPNAGSIAAAANQVRATLEINDWSAVPSGTTSVKVTVTNLNDFVSVDFENPAVQPADGFYVESNGYISMEAAKYSRVVNQEPFTWNLLPEIGRTGDGMTPFPATADGIQPGGDSARLEYDVHLFSTGEIEVSLVLSPRQNVLPSDAGSIGLSVDDGPIETAQITNAVGLKPEGSLLKKGVANNAHVISKTFQIAQAGSHVLNTWAVDPTVIVQKVVVDTGGLLTSYLGPPESMR